MFFGLPLESSADLQKIVLVLNTILLISALVVVEIIYAEKPKEGRSHLRYFFPLVIVLAGLLLYAAYAQTGKGA